VLELLFYVQGSAGDPAKEIGIPVNIMSTPLKPREPKPSDQIGLGGPPKYGWARSGKALLTAFLLLAVLIGIWELIHRLGWLWLILPALLVGGGWIALGVYSDHLVRQGRYDWALRLVLLLPMSGAGRRRLRAETLKEAGRYEEAECILREIIDRTAGARVTNATKAKTCLDLENLGEVVMETGHFEEAQRCFRDASGMYPSHSVWATGMAEALLRQGIFPESALVHVERALSLFQRGQERISSRSRLGAILATKAWALAACDRGAEAHGAIDAALKSPAQKTKGPLAQVHYKAGMSLLALSDYHSAGEHFARGAKLDPAGRWGRLCDDALRRRVAQV
jgi:tetratricopeptide (TPR) repeat protein